MRRLTALLALLALTAPAAAFDHTPLDKLLKAHVRAGRVDYAGLKQRGLVQLKRYVRSLGRARLDKMSRQQQLAFYLNAYNAIVLQQVVQRYPLTSVMKVPGFFKRFKHRVAGRSLSLDQLEHSVIRPRFKDARIHFALVCAARSCPPLRARAFGGAELSRVLDRLARRFINSRAGVRLGGARPRVSRLFQWFAADFARDAGSVGQYLARYHKTAAARLRQTTKFDYQRYDWSLNGP